MVAEHRMKERLNIPIINLKVELRAMNISFILYCKGLP